MQLSLHSLSKCHWNVDAEVPEEINLRKCGDWEQVNHPVRVTNDCLDGRWQTGSTLTGEYIEEPTTAGLKTASQPGALLPRSPGDAGRLQSPRRES